MFIDDDGAVVGRQTRRQGGESKGREERVLDWTPIRICRLNERRQDELDVERPPSRRLKLNCEVPCSSRPNLERSQSGNRNSAESALPVTKFLNRAIEVGLIEVRPHAVSEQQFRIGGLPEKKVREALFASGADQTGPLRRCRPSTPA